MRIRKAVDPAQVRLSEHFLLSDFMGNHSVYSKGLKNIFIDPTGQCLKEGVNLCREVLETILETYGPLSISYGYISPEVSRQIVKYQSPDIPSYHRWDKGAAVDIKVHHWVRDKAPIHLAHKLDELLGYSRMITYSESPFICIATQINEGDKYRKAFYENRYDGKTRKPPLHIKKSGNAAARIADGKKIELVHDWRGAGYPTYHGGGRRQLQHIAVSAYSVVSDYLYSSYALANGIANLPTLSKYRKSFRRAGATYDALLKRLEIPRLSIVRGFESFRFCNDAWYDWKEQFAIKCTPPSYMSANDVAEVAFHLPYVSAVSVSREEGEVVIVGKLNTEEV